MAITAGVDGEMLVMVKAGVVGKQHFLDRMASAAGFYAESGFPVMAGPA